MPDTEYALSAMLSSFESYICEPRLFDASPPAVRPQYDTFFGESQMRTRFLENVSIADWEVLGIFNSPFLLDYKLK